MRNATLPHAEEYCRDVVVKAIKEHVSGLTVHEVKLRLPSDLQMGVTRLRQHMDALEADDVIESEQYQSNAKVYFLYGRTPRVRVRRIRAEEAKYPSVPPASWASSLGGAVCQ